MHRICVSVRANGLFRLHYVSYCVLKPCLSEYAVDFKSQCECNPTYTGTPLYREVCKGPLPTTKWTLQNSRCLRVSSSDFLLSQLMPVADGQVF